MTEIKSYKSAIRIKILPKNQLAKEGLDSVAPVVIPVLIPALDKSLKSDRSLCLVRALLYYLDRTSGRTRSWSLSPLRKALTKTSHLPPSPHGYQADCDPML